MAEADPEALAAVPRAAGEWRRARLVVLSDGGSEHWIGAAAEGLSDDTLTRIWTLSAGDPMLALTQRRAATLHIGPTGHDPIMLPLGPKFGARTIRHLADPVSDLAQPLAGPFERLKSAPPPSAVAAIRLAKLAQLLPAAVLGQLAGPPPADLVAVDVSALEAYPTAVGRRLRRVAAASVPLADAEKAQIIAFRPEDGGPEHLVILIGDPPGDAPLLVRLHSECFTGDLLGSLRCDCGEQLRGAIRALNAAGGGAVLYLAQEGRGIGLINKLRAYRLQDDGFDTVDANLRLGFESDERLFEVAATMLNLLGWRQVRLLTNNPEKVAQLAQAGIDVVERVGHQFPANPHNAHYLATKRDRSGHYL